MYCLRYDKTQATLLLGGVDYHPEQLGEIAARLALAIDASILEHQDNGDLQIWLLDFEGSHLLLKAEHYSQSLWLESLQQGDDEVLSYLSQLLGMAC